jgi:RsiW-degrading membrane proteinase PrsW (M82 family)
VSFRCGCGRELAPPSSGDVGCPACGAVYETRPGWRSARCDCGATVLAAPGQLGQSLPCTGCYLRVSVTSDAPPAPPTLKKAGRKVSTSPSRPASSRPRWLFALTLAPLLIYTFASPPEPPLKEAVRRATERSPGFRARLDSIRTLDELFEAMEIDRLDGALHSRFARPQWLYAAAAALGAWGLILLGFPLGRASSRHLWTVGLLIGTLGILLLLGVHQLPFVKAIYAAAMGNTGFMTSLAGYLLGVGVCEELVKLLPLVIVFRRGAKLDVAGAAAWGLAMGAGFGVSEGIWYSGEFYNGLTPGLIYVVRFVSCVGLHMAWSGAAAVRLWTYRDEIEDAESDWAPALPLTLAAAGSILLHALYDVFLKFGGEGGALLTAALTFLYFFWTLERQGKAEAATS